MIKENPLHSNGWYVAILKFLLDVIRGVGGRLCPWCRMSDGLKEFNGEIG